MVAVKETTKIIKLSWLIFWQPTFRMFEKEPQENGSTTESQGY